MSDQKYTPKGITPLPWYRLEVMGKSFLAAKPTEDHPYFGKTKHMDVCGDEDYPRREADLAYQAFSATEYPKAIEALRRVLDSPWEPDKWRLEVQQAYDAAVLSAAREVEGGK